MKRPSPLLRILGTCFCLCATGITTHFTVQLSAQENPDEYTWAGEWVYYPFTDEVTSGWGVHAQHGWIYAIDSTLNHFWFWDFDLDWMWTAEGAYPYLYSNDRNSWFWYAETTTQPRWFVDIAYPDQPFTDVDGHPIPKPQPVRLHVRDVILANITDTSVTVRWTTNHGATAQVLYGTDPEDLDRVSELSDGGAQDHEIILTGLEPDTTYYFRAKSSPAAGDTIHSPVASFPTSVEPYPGSLTHGVELTLDDVGVQEGVLLYPYTGNITTSRHGQVIENMRIDGTIRINHDNVIIRNCVIRHGSANGITVSSGTTGALIEFCELDGLSQVIGNHGTLGVVIQGQAIVRRCYAHHTRTGFHAPNTTGSRIIENYVEHLVVAHGSHNASASVHGGSDVHIKRNRFVESNSSAFSLYAANNSLSDIRIQDNHFVGTNSGYGIYAGFTHPNNPNSENPHRNHNEDIRVIGNRWSDTFRWGPVAAFHDEQPGAIWLDNTWVSGEIIEPKRGI